MFSQACVKNSVHKWGCVSQHTLRQTPTPRHTPLGRHPLGTNPLCPVHAGIHTPLPSACWDTHPAPPPRQPLQRTVHIPLECFLFLRNSAIENNDQKAIFNCQTRNDLLKALNLFGYPNNE